MRPLLPLALLLTGCFYTDPINQRPSVDIQQESADAPFRGEQVALAAVASDPEGQVVGFSWRVYACTDATLEGGCDQAPFATGILVDFAFPVPLLRQDAEVPVQSLRVVLEATDELGATAKPDQQLVIPIADHAPDLMVSAGYSRSGYVDGQALRLFAKYGDSDDTAARTTVDWVVFTPDQADTFLLEDDDDVSQDPDHPELIVVGKDLTPHGVGAWSVQVTATDPLGVTTVQMLPITVSPDQPPCLEQAQPIAPLDGTSALPVTEPTLFQIPVVVDDLDVFPAVPGDPVLGVTTFTWSILPPGATTFQPLANVGNSVDFDPAAFTPGDLVELRVEIADRIPRTLTCAASDLTCSILSQPACLQRLTWRVEVQ